MDPKSKQSFERIFNPKTVAVVGATENELSVGYAVMKNMMNNGFKGKIYPINQKRDTVLGIKCYPGVSKVEEKVDLAILCVPAKVVPAVVKECGESGCGGLVIISAGFAEAGEEGKKLCVEICDYCEKYNMRMIGPNCLGIIRPTIGLNASFSSSTPKSGRVAFISQSGALCTAILDWAKDQGVGFSYFVSIGSSINVDYADLIEYLAEDDGVNAILIYMESIKEPGRFIAAARKFTSKKPILLIKAGKSSEGAAAAMSHTGSLAGNDAVYSAVFERSGCIRLNTINELWDCAHTLATQTIPPNVRLCIITNAGGPGVISTDCLIENGGKLAKLSEKTYEELNKVLPSTWSHNNPVDVIGDATPKIYRDTLKVCMEDDGIDGFVVILTPQSMTDPEGVAKLILECGPFKKPVFASWMGQSDVQKGVEILEKGGIPNFDTPERAVKAFCNIMKHSMILDNYKQKVPELPEPLGVDKESAKKLIKEVLADGRKTMTEYEAKMLMKYYKIPIAETGLAKTPEEAAEVAKKCGFPLVMKILSPDILHKTEVGGVKLNVKSPEEAKIKFNEIMESVKAKRPDAKIHGVLMNFMAEKKYELLIGMKKDPLFGPVIVFGMGGTTVELYKDTNLTLPPLDMLEVTRLMEKTKVYKLLEGYRGQAGVDINALKMLVIRFATLVADFPELSEVDINPLGIDKEGACCFDAKVIFDMKVCNGPEPKPYEHLVIKP